MAVKRRGLGKGLDTLIPNKTNSAARPEPVAAVPVNAPTDKQGESIVLLPLSKVEPNKGQPRKKFAAQAIEELAQSIKEHGVITPILVQKEDGYYQIIAGERRWRAAKKAGLKEIPAIVKNYEGAELLAVSLIENLQREDLDVIEEAQAYKRLIEEYTLTQDEVAKRVSKSRSAVTNAMRLLKLDPRVQTMLAEGSISMGHGRALLALKSEEKQYELAQRIKKEEMSVREVEKAVKEWLPSKKVPKIKAPKGNPYVREMEERMAGAVGTKVRIVEKSSGKGRIELEYYSDDELDRLYELLRHIKR